MTGTRADQKTPLEVAGLKSVITSPFPLLGGEIKTLLRKGLGAKTFNFLSYFRFFHPNLGFDVVGVLFKFYVSKNTLLVLYSIIVLTSLCNTFIE